MVLPPNTNNKVYRQNKPLLRAITCTKTLLPPLHYPGWNGKHCTLEGCPGNCNRHGQCKTNDAMEWECWCESGYFGPGCDILMEQDCSDKRDNDQGEPIKDANT